MIVRIFVPKSVYFRKSEICSKCYLVIGNIAHNDCNKSVSIYMVDFIESTETKKINNRKVIGTISDKKFDFTELPNDYIAFGIDHIKSTLALKSVHLPSFSIDSKSVQTQVFLYDSSTFLQLSHRIDEEKWCQLLDPIAQLLITIKNNESNQKLWKSNEISSSQSTDCHRSNQSRFISFLLSLSAFARIKLSFLNSAFLRHFHFWTLNLALLTQNRIHIWTIVLDVIAGIVAMFLLWRISNADEYLIQVAMYIVQGLQNLLDALKGSPVGLKLNVDLNNFFIESFRYHVDLWGTFLVIISPLVKYLFAPLTIIGCFGLSFQLSMLSDLLSIITLHAHCIYIYASIIYKIEINGLIGVWRVVSGRRKNVLKDRIESYDYSNQQLYLSILFFTALLFLFPTILIYYVVFASLRLGIYCITYSLTLVQRKLLSLPVYYIVEWCLGQYANSDNFEVMLIDDVKSSDDSLHMSLFLIKTVQSSLPSWIQVIEENTKEK